jgi:hypothetical protein
MMNPKTPYGWRNRIVRGYPYNKKTAGTLDFTCNPDPNKVRRLNNLSSPIPLKKGTKSGFDSTNFDSFLKRHTEERSGQTVKSGKEQKLQPKRWNIDDLDKLQFKDLKQAANDGDNEAQFQMGKIYLTGKKFQDGFVVQKDLQEAIMFVTLAAVRGNVDAREFLRQRGMS